jgi:hypothetical protein
MEALETIGIAGVFPATRRTGPLNVRKATRRGCFEANGRELPMGKSKPSIPPTRLRLLPAGPLPFTASHAVGSEVIAGGRTEDVHTKDETPEPPADYIELERKAMEDYRDLMKTEQLQLPIDKQEAFQRFTMGLPMNIHHVAAVAGISIHGVANAVHRGRLRRRSMQAEAGFHPDDVRAWVWGPAERVGG